MPRKKPLISGVIMDCEALIQLALEASSSSQRELAAKLGVSPTQITKWKSGEHMSPQMEAALRVIANIGDREPWVIRAAGSVEAAEKWDRLIRYLAEAANEEVDSAYDISPLHDEQGMLSWQTLEVLREMGVAIPREFPKELDVDYEDVGSWDPIDGNPYSALIYGIYKSFVGTYSFYAAHVETLIENDELDLLELGLQHIEPHLLHLAACKIKVDAEFAPKFHQFKRGVTNDYEAMLTTVKVRAFRAGVPLRAELLGMVYDSADELCDQANGSSLKFKEARVHPDIYMNELLVGMKMLHQVLPAIVKKLGISNSD